MHGDPLSLELNTTPPCSFLQKKVRSLNCISKMRLFLLRLPSRTV
jgi:hypothetical protein